uniref:Uncharacterized protein n=1 Tax=Myotis myotis TaxID=51298 RepID=A0A7J7R9C6_MYOMY|nr:hypothetical protein mMyoMyo1_010867 [Myotis myotis]
MLFLLPRTVSSQTPLSLCLFLLENYLRFKAQLKWPLLQEAFPEPQPGSEVPSGLPHPSPARSGSALSGDESVGPAGPGRVEPGLSPLPLCVPSTQLGTENARGEKRMARVRVSVSVKRLQVPGAKLCRWPCAWGPAPRMSSHPSPPIPDLLALF